MIIDYREDGAEHLWALNFYCSSVNYNSSQQHIFHNIKGQWHKILNPYCFAQQPLSGPHMNRQTLFCKLFFVCCEEISVSPLSTIHRIKI